MSNNWFLISSGQVFLRFYMGKGPGFEILDRSRPGRTFLQQAGCGIPPPHLLAEVGPTGATSHEVSDDSCVKNATRPASAVRPDPPSTSDERKCQIRTVPSEDTVTRFCSCGHSELRTRG